MSNIVLERVASVARVATLPIGRSITGVLAGTGPQIAWRDATGARGHGEFSTLSIEQVGEETGTVALILPDHALLELGWKIRALAGARVTISALANAYPGKSYRIDEAR